MGDLVGQRVCGSFPVRGGPRASQSFLGPPQRTETLWFQGQGLLPHWLVASSFRLPSLIGRTYWF